MKISTTPDSSAGVDRKLALRFGALVLILMLTVTVMASLLFVRIQRDEENRLSGALAQVIGESISKISFSGKYQARLLVEELNAKVPEVDSISVVSKDGYIIAHSDPAKNDTPVAGEDLKMIRQSLAENKRVVYESRSGSKTIKQVILPYRGEFDSEVMGVVKLGVQVDDARTEQAANILILLILGILLSSAAIWIVLVLSRRFGSTVRELADQLQGILDNSPAMIYMKDRSGRYTFVNRHWCELLHAQVHQVQGKTDLELFPEETALRFMENDRIALASSQPLDVEEQAILEDGQHLYHSIKLALRDRSGNAYGLCGISTDITERKRADEEKEKLLLQLAQSQKMESVGRLAGGVAHDFNNMLTAILGYTELGLMKTKPSEPQYSYLNEIMKAANRSADLTRQLLAFARRQPINPVIIDINASVTGMLQMLRRIIGEDINLSWKPQERLWKTKMDPSQLDQILANLCANSRDAIDGVGIVSIETANIEFDEKSYSNHAEIHPGEYVMLAVSDNGRGIEKDLLDHIFEPFFTTKEVGKGTGLGLATVYGIAQQNEGFISVYSEPGLGTTFKIYIPKAKDESSAPDEAKTAKAPGSRGETILLVEDEKTVLNLVENMLEGLGYTVLAAETPKEALSLAEVYGKRIQLLVTDVVMPAMNGRYLADQLRALKPDLRCLFISGYTADVIAKKGVLDESMHFLQKPFSVHALAEKVREALDDTGTNHG